MLHDGRSVHPLRLFVLQNVAFYIVKDGILRCKTRLIRLANTVIYVSNGMCVKPKDVNSHPIGPLFTSF